MTSWDDSGFLVRVRSYGETIYVFFRFVLDLASGLSTDLTKDVTLLDNTCGVLSVFFSAGV